MVIVTDTDHAYADLASAMPHDVVTVRLYRSYLESFPRSRSIQPRQRDVLAPRPEGSWSPCRQTSGILASRTTADGVRQGTPSRSQIWGRSELRGQVLAINAGDDFRSFPDRDRPDGQGYAVADGHR